ncbi:hypothetical protein [Paenibacillus eucommiae]|uniref:Uncharacterized protein n=1 Tax=Paenibacillus eucommiae TaxID=1355755 RepID=A0ABS4IY93_9BACL|nr:hypothetical protein [Paenibacillus eucommiae]MBP1992554.1 hypothetical protein [Paenibacillus eucommiae]
MINTIQVQGSLETSWHNFSLVQEAMDISISSGEYWRGGIRLATVEESTRILINSPEEDTQLEIWICSDGETAVIELYQSGDSLDELQYTPIDRLAWFSVLSGAVTMDDIEINVVQMVGA